MGVFVKAVGVMFRGSGCSRWRGDLDADVVFNVVLEG